MRRTIQGHDAGASHLFSAAGRARAHGRMTPIRIFVSSVQKEFAEVRAALRDYLRGDALMRRFFEVFLFEDVPAADRRADELYLDEVRRCDLYVGLLGNDYGSEDAEGLSPTEREFELASATGKYRLIYVRGTDDAARHPKMRALVSRVQAGLVRKRFLSEGDARRPRPRAHGVVRTHGPCGAAIPADGGHLAPGAPRAPQLARQERFGRGPAHARGGAALR